jgi:hypothetical protein
MNVPRRIAALKREIRYRQDEIERIATLRAAREDAVIAFPNLVEKYLADIRVGIADREVEICRLQQEDHQS